jgi:hypothetical protein
MAVAGKSPRARTPRREQPRRIRTPEVVANGDEVLDFLRALDRWKHQHQRSCPSWSELLQLLHELGYRRNAARR